MASRSAASASKLPIMREHSARRLSRS
jgi:hypothetical protein